MDLVVLHVTVADGSGQFVADLKQGNFRVFEQSIEQKLAFFSRDDIPVTMGLVIDNSGSMREKRDQVNAAAMTFVRTSNPQDEAFVVNFNDEYYLDTDGEFTSDQANLHDALSRIDTRGSTALYDAVIGSLAHLKKGHKDKRVLLLVTDGEDTASEKTFEDAIKASEESNATIYAIGVYSEDDLEHDKRMVRRSKKVLSRTRGSYRRTGVFSGQTGAGDADLRAGGARDPQPVHAGLLPREYGPRRHVPARAGEGDPAEWPRQAVRAHPHRVLRSEGCGRRLSKASITSLGALSCIDFAFQPPPIVPNPSRREPQSRVNANLFAAAARRIIFCLG